MPSLVRLVLETWAFWLSEPTVALSEQGVAISLVFLENIPPSWITETIHLEDEQLAESYRR